MSEVNFFSYPPFNREWSLNNAVILLTLPAMKRHHVSID